MYWTCLLLMFGGALAYDASIYEGYQLVQVLPKSTKDVQTLEKLTQSLSGMSPRNAAQIQVWTEPRVGHSADVFVSSEAFTPLVDSLHAFKIQFDVSPRNIAAELEASWQDLVGRGRWDSMVYDINDYNTYDDIMAETERLASICPNTGLTCATEDYGTSHEGRILKAIRISSGVAGLPVILIDSNIHAREWLAVATTMNIMDKLITGYGSDADATRLLDGYDFVFIPIMNPDGYVFTWTDDRMWRKNRTPNADSPCIGTDLNRNYAFGWGNPGASDRPCDDTYHGSSSASEPETAATQTYFQTLQPLCDASFHSYGYYFLSPYGDCSNPPNWLSHVRPVLDAACAAIEGTFGEDWLCGNSCEELYATSGTSVDYCTGSVNSCTYSFTPELRGPGFDPPAASIGPSVEQMWNGVIAMVDQITVEEA